MAGYTLAVQPFSPLVPGVPASPEYCAGVDQVLPKLTLPVGEPDAATADDTQVSKLPGVLGELVQPVGGVAVNVPKLYDPPVGVAGAVAEFWNTL